MKMKKKRKIEFWRYNEETGNPQHLRAWVYVLVIFLHFMVFAGYGVISWLWLRGFENFVWSEFIDVSTSYGKTAAIKTLQFFIIYYVTMTILGAILQTDGDPLQRRLFHALRNRRIYKSAAKDIHSIRIGSRRRLTNITRTKLPMAVVVCEKIEITNGVFRRVPMALNVKKMENNTKVVFDPCHVMAVFDKDHVFSGKSASEIISEFNTIAPGIDTMRLLRNCDGLAVLEFKIVYDETVLKENIFATNLLRLQVHKIPCTTNSKGKIRINDIEAFTINEKTTERYM